MERASYIEQLQWGVDHIEAHLDEDLAIADVARAAGLSRWHFQRIFSAITGETLMSYVRSRRMALACERLASTETRVIDIAVLAGFGSHEAFTRAFKKIVGVTPTDYRRANQPLPFVSKVQFDSNYLSHITTNVSLEPQIERRNSMTMVGMETHFYGTGSDRNNIADRIPALWQSFLPREEEIADRILGTGYGLIVDENKPSDQLRYQASWEVTTSRAAAEAITPQGMTVFEVPAATYAVFAHRGPASQLDHTVNYAYSTWLTGSGRRHSGGPDLEIFGPAYDPVRSDSVIHYGIPLDN